MMPRSVTEPPGRFDRFAAAASGWVSRAWFFSACVGLIVVWMPSFFVLGDVDTWQLVINTATTIVTFLLVALLQNAQQRADQATQHKLNAIAAGVAAMMQEQISPSTSTDARWRVYDARRELVAAVGLEERESA